MERLSVDRLEGEFAVCEKENGSFVDMPLSGLPGRIRPGNILLINDDQSVTLDTQEEESRKNDAFQMYLNLFDNNDNNNGEQS